MKSLVYKLNRDLLSIFFFNFEDEVFSFFSAADIFLFEYLFGFFSSYYLTFLLFFIPVVCFSFMCVFSKNVIWVLFSLVSVFIFISGLLLSLHVEFLAVIYIMVYVGAIIILFLFSLVFLDFRLQKKNTFDISLCILVFIALGYFLSINLDSLFIFLKYMQKENSYLYSDANYDYFYIFFFNDVNIFISLYTKFSVLLLTVAFILLIVMIGSVSLCLSLSKKNNFKTNKPFFFNFNY